MNQCHCEAHMIYMNPVGENGAMQSQFETAAHCDEIEHHFSKNSFAGLCFICTNSCELHTF